MVKARDRFKIGYRVRFRERVKSRDRFRVGFRIRFTLRFSVRVRLGLGLYGGGTHQRLSHKNRTCSYHVRP